VAAGGAETARATSHHHCWNHPQYCSPLAHFRKPLPTVDSLGNPVAKPAQGRKKLRLDQSWSESDGRSGLISDGDGVEKIDGDWVEVGWKKPNCQD
jgi:hypothetical protein